MLFKCIKKVIVSVVVLLVFIGLFSANGITVAATTSVVDSQGSIRYDYNPLYRTPLMSDSEGNWVFCIEPYEQMPRGEDYTLTAIENQKVKRLLQAGVFAPDDLLSKYPRTLEQQYISIWLVLQIIVNNQWLSLLDNADPYLQALVAAAESGEDQKPALDFQVAKDSAAYYDSERQQLVSEQLIVKGTQTAFELTGLGQGYYVVDETGNKITGRLNSNMTFRIATTELFEPVELHLGIINHNLQDFTVFQYDPPAGLEYLQTLVGGLLVTEPITVNSQTITFQPIAQGIKLIKVDQNGFPRENIGFQFSSSMDENDIIFEAFTDKAGMIAVDHLSVTDIYVREFMTDNDLIIDSSWHKTTLIPNETVTISLTNEITSQVYIEKSDVQSNEPVDAVFSVTVNGEQGMNLRTGTSGQATLEFLKKGDIACAQETWVMEPYILDDTQRCVEISENNAQYYLPFTNAKAYGKITARKQNREGTEFLGGAEYGLYHIAGIQTVEKIQADNQMVINREVLEQFLVETQISDEQGLMSWSNLMLSEYFLLELQAPVGYSLNSNPVAVNVAYEGYLVPEVHIKDVILIDELSSIDFILSKRDAETNEVIIDNKLVVQLFDGNMVLVCELTYENQWTVSLHKGQYYIKERIAPANYELDTEVYPIEINGDELKQKMIYDFFNDPAVIAGQHSLPDTAAASRTLKYSIILVLSGLLLLLKQLCKS